MLLKDYRAEALGLVRAYSEEWLLAGPLGLTLSLAHGSNTAVLTVTPHYILLPSPPDGGYRTGAWTVEVEGLDRAYRTFGARRMLGLLAQELSGLADTVRATYA